MAEVLDVLEGLASRIEQPNARGLAQAVSRAVGEGSLGTGDRLPPIRALAERLGLSPTTVSAAWALLLRSGTIRTDGRRGTVVAPRHAVGPTRYRQALQRRTAFDLDLSTGTPDPQLLPDLGPPLHQLHGAATPGSYLDDPVLPQLTQLLRADWPFAPAQLTVVDGAMDALDQALGSLVRFGDRVVVEHPCFPPLLDLLDALGADTVGASTDAQGMTPQALRGALAKPAVAVILQPRAQNPTGAALTEERAAELAAVVRPTSAVVIEDDSAGAVANSPLISLGRWLPERVVHVRSFSKSHGPDLRLAAVGGPAELMDLIVERRLLGQGWTSRLLQQVLIELLTDRDSVQQVRRARREYARRRRLIVNALRANGVELPDGDGINLWLPVADESAALVRLASHGIGATPGRPFAVQPEDQAYLRVTVGLVRERHREIAALLGEAAHAGGWPAPR